MRILIIENDSVSRLVLSGILSHHGAWEISIVNSIEEGWKSLNASPHPEICILDLFDTEDQADSFIRNIHRTPKLSKIKLIVVCDIDNSDCLEKMASLGVHDVLLKPFDASAVLKEIHRITGIVAAGDAVESPETVCRRLGIKHLQYYNLLSVLVLETEHALSQIHKDLDTRNIQNPPVLLRALLDGSRNLGASKLSLAIQSALEFFSETQGSKSPDFVSAKHLIQNLQDESQKLRFSLSQIVH